MALQISQNPDGTLHFDAGPDGHLVMTRPQHTGELTLADGTAYNVGPTFVEVDSPEHALELAELLDAATAAENPED